MRNCLFLLAVIVFSRSVYAFDKCQVMIKDYHSLIPKASYTIDLQEEANRSKYDFVEGVTRNSLFPLLVLKQGISLDYQMIDNEILFTLQRVSEELFALNTSKLSKDLATQSENSSVIESLGKFIVTGEDNNSIVKHIGAYTVHIKCH